MPGMLCFPVQLLHMQSLLHAFAGKCLYCLASICIPWVKYLGSLCVFESQQSYSILQISFSMALSCAVPCAPARGADLVVAETESEANIIRGCALDAIFELQLSQAQASLSFEKVQLGQDSLGSPWV